MSKGKLQYKDSEGNIGEGQKQTDLERNNKILEKLVTVGRLFVIIFGCLIFTIIWLITYVIKNNVLNNIVASCI